MSQRQDEQKEQEELLIKRESNLAKARAWKLGVSKIPLPELIKRVVDVEQRLMRGPGWGVSSKVLLDMEDRPRWERSWIEANNQLLKYGRRLVKERGGKI